MKRKSQDPVYKLSCVTRSLIYKAFSRNGYNKRTKTYDIIGCCFTELIIHLNDNEYGFKYEYGLYDIDHIIPLSSATTEEEIIKLNHYSNLQLLPSKYNQHIKRDNVWDKEHFENWLLNKIDIFSMTDRGLH